MVSEVNGPRPGTINSVENRNTKIDKAGATQGASPIVGAGADVVTLTDLASRLQSLVSSVARIPIADQDKIATFRQALADGSYHVDSQAVAEKLSAVESLLAELSVEK
ncbi:MAG: negative regulator of flagellin synthesis FlgM [Gammaproteobacteria bacterium]|jgi:negative regulator of flagellin synthesis FlgM